MQSGGWILIAGICLLVGCNQSPESRCEEAVEHTSELVAEDPMFNIIPAQERATMLADLENRQAQGVKNCMQSFNEQKVNCVIHAHNMEEMRACL